MGKKRIRVRYTELMTLLNIFKVTVDMDEISLEKCKIRNASLTFEFLTRNSSLGELTMYFAYLKELGDALLRNSKEIYCRSDITD